MMFCPKCGTKALDDAEFCQKCGAKLIADTPVGQSASAHPASSAQVPTQTPRSGFEKKKSKLPIILGVVAALIIVLVIIAVIGSKVGSNPSTDNSQPPAGYLTYTNTEEGISFQYPDTLQEGSLSEAGTYFTDDSMTMIVYLLARTVNGGQTPILDIRKVPATQSVMDEVFSATLSNVAPEGNMIVTEIDDGSIGDIPYRKFTLATKANDGSDITIQRYVYFVNSFQYQIEFSGYTDDMESNEIKSFIDDLMDSYTIRTDSSVAPSNGTPAAEDQLLFQGTPIQDIMGAHSSDIIALFGEPAMYTENYELDYSPMEMGMYFELSDGDIVDRVSSLPSHFTYNGESLAQNFDALVAILGENYTDMGGTMYTWEVFWNYGDYQIYFSFSRDSDDDKPYSIDVMKSDSETPVDDDDYSWVPGDIDDSLLRDQALVGRWRSYDGGSVEFDEYGNAAVSFRPNASILPPDYITWEASNGQIVLSSRFSDTYRWELSERGSKQYLTLSTLTSTIYARSESDTSLVGTWDEIGDGYRNTDALVLYADGTGTINKVVSSATWAREIIPITWWTDDTNFNYEWTTRSAYDYTVSGDILTIYFSNGSQIYTKVGN